MTVEEMIENLEKAERSMEVFVYKEATLRYEPLRCMFINPDASGGIIEFNSEDRRRWFEPKGVLIV